MKEIFSCCYAMFSKYQMTMISHEVINKYKHNKIYLFTCMDNIIINWYAICLNDLAVNKRMKLKKLIQLIKKGIRLQVNLIIS